MRLVRFSATFFCIFVCCVPKYTRAQTPAACPVLLVEPYSGMYGWDIRLHNQSDKDVMAVKIHMIYLDRARDEHPSSVEHTYDSTIKAGAIKKWRMTDGNDPGSSAPGGARIHISKVLYADGSTWTPVDQTCDVTLFRDRGGNYLKPQPSQ
jgi:hypothetical protein